MLMDCVSAVADPLLARDATEVDKCAPFEQQPPDFATTIATTEKRAHSSAFTVTYTNRAAVAPCRASRGDMTAQREAVKAYRQTRQEAYIQRHTQEAALSEGDRCIAVKMLLHSAAVRDVELARKAGYEKAVVSFMRHTWAAFLQQARSFLSNDAAACAAMGVESLGDASRGVVALENVSSLGIWFSGPLISLPLRRYALQTSTESGAAENVVVVGLVSFCYSSYVIQLRMMSQAQILTELNAMHEELSTACLFTPPLLVAPTATTTS